MLRSTLILTLSIIALTAARADDSTPPKLPPVDFEQAVKDPRGKPFPSCADSTADCQKPMSLGVMVYAALSAAPRDPRTGQPTPGNPRDGALAWKILAAREPLPVSTDDRSTIKSSLFREFAPGAAYAACRLIVSPDECEK